MQNGRLKIMEGERSLADYQGSRQVRKPDPLLQKREESGELDMASWYTQFTRRFPFWGLACETIDRDKERDGIKQGEIVEA